MKESYGNRTILIKVACNAETLRKHGAKLTSAHHSLNEDDITTEKRQLQTNISEEAPITEITSPNKEQTNAQEDNPTKGDANIENSSVEKELVQEIASPEFFLPKNETDSLSDQSEIEPYEPLLTVTGLLHCESKTTEFSNYSEELNDDANVQNGGGMMADHTKD